MSYHLASCGKVKRIEDNSIIDTVEISQDKNGIDKEDRVQKLKNYLSSKVLLKAMLQIQYRFQVLMNL